MKKIGLAIAVFFAAIFTHSSLKEEGEEFDYVMNSMNFLIDWRTNQAYRIACHEESKINQGENAVSIGQIGGLIDKGYMVCALDGRIGVLLGVGKALTETAYVPIRAAIPYEMAKTALQSEKIKKCSDYIKPLIVACPSLLKPYLQRVEFVEQAIDPGNSDS